MTKDIKNRIKNLFYRQIILSVGNVNIIVSNGSGQYKHYKIQEVLDNIDTGEFYPFKITNN